jgi:hypothetical protein
MCIAVIAYGVDKAFGEEVFGSVSQLGFHGAFDAVYDMSLAAPMIGKIAWRIGYLPYTNFIPEKSTPFRMAGNTGFDLRIYTVEIRNRKRERREFHVAGF